MAQAGEAGAGDSKDDGGEGGVKIARVFPRRTSFSPNDDDTYFNMPGLFTPDYDEVHVSCVFTWDKQRAFELVEAWKHKAKVINVGGPAFNDPGNGFTPGFYLREGVTITSRGCPNSCSWCLVSNREGKLRELDVKPGNIIQDNNILACSAGHLDKVFTMLAGQRQIEFKGGLEAARITPEIVDRLRGLSIKTLWVACDYPAAIKPLQKAVDTLNRAGFTQNHIYCYVLIGDDRQENEARLRRVFEIGAMPFAQLYQPPDEYIRYPEAWRHFAREWSRPAIYKSIMGVRSA